MNAFGLSIAFTTIAVVIAQVFVSSPFYIRQAKTSFEDIDLSFENAARTLGASQVYTFFHVILPIACNGLISGAVMSFARSLGEFGATIMFAGNFHGRTQTCRWPFTPLCKEIWMYHYVWPMIPMAYQKEFGNNDLLGLLYRLYP